MKIVSVIGARPNFVKIIPIINESRKRGHEHILVHTGQHYDFRMSQIFFQELKLPKPDYNLNIKANHKHGEQTAEILKKTENVLEKEKPDVVIVVGDTNSSLGGALAAKKLNIKVVHVEAGLRAYDLSIPEEVNRILIDVCSDFLFCPTDTAVKNLKNSKDITGKFWNVGNISIDTLIQNKNLIPEWPEKGYCIFTTHRPVNVDRPKRLELLIEIINSVSEMIKIIFPIHPRTKKMMQKYKLISKIKKNVKVIEPLGYLDFHSLLNNSSIVITDSGGIIAEACYRGIPCLIMPQSLKKTNYNLTEWTETLGRNSIFIGLDQKIAVENVKNFLRQTNNGERKLKNPYPGWNGNSSKKIFDILEGEL